MSASPMARAATQGQDIPTRRVVITSEEDMLADYSSTPGRNSSDAMAQQEWKVVRRRRSSEGCNMLASPMARAATQGQDIPTRRVVITSEEDMPADYSSTPGGTIFGTTPGGTKIVYERAFLVNLRNSPLSRTPPTNLPNIPGVTSDLGKKELKLENHIEVPNNEADQNADDQFSMDI